PCSYECIHVNRMICRESVTSIQRPNPREAPRRVMLRCCPGPELCPARGLRYLTFYFSSSFHSPLATSFPSLNSSPHQFLPLQQPANKLLNCSRPRPNSVAPLLVPLHLSVSCLACTRRVPADLSITNGF